MYFEIEAGFFFLYDVICSISVSYVNNIHLLGRYLYLRALFLNEDL